MDANDRSIALFTMLGHATFHTYELSIPVFVAIWLGAFDVSPAVLGLIVGAGYALIGLGAPVSGVLADSRGSKTLVLVSLAGMGGGFLLLSVAPSVLTIGVALVLWGAAASLYHPAGLSLISRGARSRGRTLAYHGAAGNVGTALGPLVAVILLALFGWRTVAALLCIPAAAAVLSGVRLQFDETAAVANGSAAGTTDLRAFVRNSRALFTGGFLVLFIVYMIYGIYYRGAFTFLPEVLSSLPTFPPMEVLGRPVEPGRYVYSGLLMVGAFGQYAGGWLSERTNPERSLVAIFAVMVVVTLAFVPASDAGAVPLLAVCAAIGFLVYVFAPITQSLIAEYAAADVHGLSYGYTYLGGFGVGALGAAIAGFVLSVSSTATLFVVLAAIAGVCALLASVLAIRY